MGRSRVLSFMSQFGGPPRSPTQPSSPTSVVRPEPSVPSSQQIIPSPARDAGTPPRARLERPSSRPMSMVHTYHPPLMEIPQDTIPELQPIFTFLNSHSNKLYQEGYFLKLNDLDSSGRPNGDRTWTECFAQLVGTVLSLWDAAALDAAGQDGEVVPNFINLTDACITMIETLPTRSDDGRPLQNVLSVSTAGKNRYLLHFNSLHSLTQWTAAIRLAMFEHASLQELYTGSLIAGKGKTLNNIRGIMERTKLKTEDWVRVRFGAGTPWRRCWCVISPPDEKEYQKLQKQTKKRSAYDRVTPRLKGDIKFYDSKKTKKVKPIASINDAYGCHAIYPQSKPLIDQSTLIKVEGIITIHSQPPSTTEGFVFVMPEIHPAVSGFEMMLRWLFPAFDTFSLYGRPERLIADTLDVRGLMFAMPNDRRYGYLEILDVAGLILTEGSQKWKEADWRRNLKELTAKRIKVMMADGGRPGVKSSTRRANRSSLQLPSRNSALQFDDNLSTRSSPASNNPLRLDRSANGSPQKAGLASALGNSLSPLRHHRSVSEAQGISRLQEQAVYDAPPPPPPHAVSAGVTGEPPRLDHSSHSNDVGNDHSSSDGDLQVSDQANASIQDLPPSNPPDPVVAPPAFAHAPGARPASKPFHSPEQRWANSRMSTTTISQITGLNSIATAAAAAAWKPQPRDHQENDTYGRTDEQGMRGESVREGQQIQGMPTNSAEGDLRGVFADASVKGAPADYSDAHKEVVTSAAGPARSDHPLPLPPPEELGQPLPESRQYPSPNSHRLSSYEKELPPLNHELPLIPGASSARTNPARPDFPPGYRSPLSNQATSALPYSSAGAFRTGSPELPPIPGRGMGSRPAYVAAGASSSHSDDPGSSKEDQFPSDASFPPRDVAHPQFSEAAVHGERLPANLRNAISPMPTITRKPVPDRSLSDKATSDSPTSSPVSGDQPAAQNTIVTPVSKYPQNREVEHLRRQDSNASSYYGDDTTNSPGDAITPDATENSRPDYQVQGPWTELADSVEKDATKGGLENRIESTPRPTQTQTPNTKSALRPTDGSGTGSRPSTGSSSRTGAHGSSELSESSKSNAVEVGKRTVQFHPSTLGHPRPKSEFIEGKVGMGQGDHSRSGSESSSSGALRTPSGGHLRSRSFETEVSGGGRTIPWQPGMTTGGVMAKQRQGTVTPEQYVQQRATQPRLTPVYAHQKRPSLGALRPDTSSSSGRNSPPAAIGQRPLPHGRVPSTEFNPRPLSRGMTMPAPAVYSSPLRSNSSVDVSSHLSAREQEHVARVTGLPLINMAGSGRPHVQSGGLVGAIEAREREKRELKEGYTGQMVQHAIMLRRQQEAQMQAQTQTQAQSHAQAQMQARAQAQAQAQQAQFQAQVQAAAEAQAHAQIQAQAQAQIQQAQMQAQAQAQARYYEQQQQQHPGATGFTRQSNRSQPQLGSTQLQQPQQPLTPQQVQQLLQQQHLARQYPSQYQPPYGPYGQ